jgi:hypothetical protein
LFLKNSREDQTFKRGEEGGETEGEKRPQRIEKIWFNFWGGKIKRTV